MDSGGDMLGIERHLFPGGNTCYGFYSFYEYMVTPEVERKIILKGGPGVGKSTFMAEIARKFAARGVDIEYHWCSSDNLSLDGIVVGNNRICLVDGTHPHIVDPRYPGAVDEIINLGDYWNRDLLKKSRKFIIQLTQEISKCFSRAYIKLKQAKASLEELKSYYWEYTDCWAVNRNILALGADFVNGFKPSSRKPRHLFAGAITPQGTVTKIDSTIDKDFELVLVKGNPGTGTKQLFKHVSGLLELNNSYAEVLHNPFDPEDIDAIVVFEPKVALIDITPVLINYRDYIKSNRIKRFLDFDQFITSDRNQQLITSAKNQFLSGISEAISLIQAAKSLHDELEGYYLPAMDFARINEVREGLFAELNRLI
jgi:hypothetical protein